MRCTLTGRDENSSNPLSGTPRVTGRLPTGALGRVLGRYRLVLWVIVILVCVVPWASYQPHAHWDRVGWWPLLSPPIRVRDLVVNIALYVPLGVFVVSPGADRRRGILWAVVWAGGLSVATETTQVFSHGRFPNATDVVMNMLGAAVGGVLARRGRGRPTRSRDIVS
jgi:VanZ family protein